MRKLLPLLALASGACTSPPRLAYDLDFLLPVPAEIECRIVLGDPSLDFIRVGPSPDYGDGSNKEEQLARDTNLREFSTAANSAGEQMDNWWATQGADLIAAAAAEPRR